MWLQGRTRRNNLRFAISKSPPTHIVQQQSNMKQDKFSVGNGNSEFRSSSYQTAIEKRTRSRGNYRCRNGEGQRSSVCVFFATRWLIQSSATQGAALAGASRVPRAPPPSPPRVASTCVAFQLVKQKSSIIMHMLKPTLRFSFFLRGAALKESEKT